MLRGGSWQQRAWTWGNSSNAPAPAFGRMGMGQRGAQLPYGPHGAEQLAQQLPGRYTSPCPLSLLEGVEFTCVGAGVCRNNECPGTLLIFLPPLSPTSSKGCYTISLHILIVSLNSLWAKKKCRQCKCSAASSMELLDLYVLTSSFLSHTYCLG